MVFLSGTPGWFPDAAVRAARRPRLQPIRGFKTGVARTPAPANRGGTTPGGQQLAPADRCSSCPGRAPGQGRDESADDSVNRSVNANERGSPAEADETSGEALYDQLVAAIREAKETESSLKSEVAARFDPSSRAGSKKDVRPARRDPEKAKRVEDRYRSESELTRETVGTGIGLALVHQLVTLMGGTVDVVSGSPGAEFRLHFEIAATSG